jgi:hypothetical protein
MNVSRLFGLCGICFGVLGCNIAVVQSPKPAGIQIEVIKSKVPGIAPNSTKGACWGSDVTPMIIETVTEQQLVVPEKQDAVGNVLEPAIFRTKTVQRIVQDRSEIWFRTPCREELTVAYVATLQRALKARGLLPYPVSGVFDAPTAAAIRSFQADRGLDSPILSLAAAKELGLAVIPIKDL